MTKRMIIMLIIVGILFGGIFGFQIFKGHMIKEYMSSMSAPPQTVSTMEAAVSDWRTQLQAVGSLRAVKGADLSAEVSGIVEEIHFDSGNDVKEGTLLIKLRAEDDIGKLHSLQAAEKLAQIIYDRDVKQLKAQAIAQATLDTDKANLDSAKAQVVEQEAVVAKKFIRAPFSGHLGIRQVDVGQYLNPGTLMVTLQQLDPIYLDFFLPQQAIAQLAVGQEITVKNDTWPDKTFTGTIAAINPKVDESTRNVQIRAELKNPDHTLLPGMYATAVIEVGEPQSLITLPQTAITYNPYGDTVFIAEDKGANDKGEKQLVAHQTFVTIGQTRGDQVAIVKGLKEGDIVVTSGQVKLQNGTPLIVNNKVTPSNDANPAPEDH